MIIRRILLLLSCALALSGCLPPATFVPVAPPSGFSWQQGTPSLDEGEWWKAFSDPALDRLVETVLGANNDFALAGLKAKTALLRASLSGVDSLPKAGAQASDDRRYQLEQSGAESRSTAASFSLGYDIDLWGKIAAARDQADFAAKASEEDRAAARLQTVAATLSVWWRLGAGNEALARAGDSLAAARRAAQLVETARGAGTAGELESLQAGQAIESQLARIEDLRKAQEEQRVELSVLLNGAANPSGEPSQLGPRRLPALPAALPARLLARRPDLRAAELRLRAALRRTDESQASFYPSLSLRTSVSGSGLSLAEIADHPVAALGSSLVLPFVDLPRMAAELRVSRAVYEEERAQFRGRLLTALSEVAKGLVARDRLARKGRHVERSLALQRQVEELQETRFRAGTIGLKPLLDAQEQRRQLEAEAIANRLERLLNEALLYRAMGGTPDASEAR